MDYKKFPRTFHVPWSEGATSDDKVLTSVNHFIGKEVVVSLKMDGECTSIYAGGHTHARSMDSKVHPSRTWVRALAGKIGALLPENMRVTGENLFAKHSIFYTNLPDYFMVFGIFETRKDGDFYLAWDEVLEWCELLQLIPVPTLYRGVWDEEKIKACFTGTSPYGPQEGYVVRLAAEFKFEDYAQSTAKVVRKGHVGATDEHWLHQKLVKNQLK